MERLTILKQKLMRSVITVALVMACAMAWAETTVETYYIDENGEYTLTVSSPLTSQFSPLNLVFTCCASSMVTRFGPKRSW